ncbi:unnamed protein product [Prorocentrum cordatum]|uniref:Uncharacterized protein n=1 Tax=Prorocentrum cordatum TaxID=2364126 RepID=A0ABN9Y1C8_9DINO|nr:unnamed protein product [Polarella glacialis]
MAPRAAHWLCRTAYTGDHVQEDMGEHWGAVAQACVGHLNRYFNYEGDGLAKRTGHFELPTYRWQDIENPAAMEATATQAWAEGAEWPARRLKDLHDSASAWLAKGRDDANFKYRVDVLAKSLLSHPIVMPLFPRRASDHQQYAAEQEGVVDENDDEALPGVFEGETSPDFPQEEAEVVQGRLAAKAPLSCGPEAVSWSDTCWPDIESTLGCLTADTVTDSELSYILCMIKLLDIASRRSWLTAHRASAASGRRWVRTRGQKGAGAIHRWTKPANPWQPQTTAGDTQNLEDHALVHPQAVADNALAGWESIWGDTLNEQDPWLQAPTDLEMAADWHPRLWQLGGYAGAARIASARNAVGAGAPWPAAQSTILFYFPAKPHGCYRNLGLIPELARLWETIRVPCARGWETKNRRDYDLGSPRQDLDSAVTYFDLVKCFELATHAKVWEAGLRRGFNHIILTVIPRIHIMVRRAVLADCYIEGRQWARGIVAGSRFAPVCPKMVFFAELDGVAQAFPRADTFLFFDDLAGATRGPRQPVLHWRAALAQTLLRASEQTLGMQVSKGERGKTATMTSAPSLQPTLAKRIRPMNRRMATPENHLGITAGAGRRRRAAAFSKRAAKFLARRDHIARAMGLADAKVGELRQSVASSCNGNAKGDPGATANVAPLLAWAQARHEAEHWPHLIGHLQAAWKRWAPKVARAKVPWQIARAPAGAFIAAVRRLGWQTQGAHSIAIGAEVLDLRILPLRELRCRVKQATEQSRKDAWLAKWGETHQLESLFAEPKGAVADPICNACNAEAGTDSHRTFACAARNEDRRAVCGLHVAQRGARPWPGSEQLWGRGLASDPAVEAGLWQLPSASEMLVHGECDGPVTGDVYADGSLLNGAHAALRRGGWCFAQLTEKNELKHAVYGPRPGGHELVSVLRIFQVAFPPIHAWPDCRAILGGFARGPAWAVHPATLRSDLRRERWERIAEHGGVGPRGISFS